MNNELLEFLYKKGCHIGKFLNLAPMDKNKIIGEWDRTVTYNPVLDEYYGKSIDEKVLLSMKKDIFFAWVEDHYNLRDNRLIREDNLEDHLNNLKN